MIRNYPRRKIAPLGLTLQSEKLVDALEFNESVREQAGPICRDLRLGVEVNVIIESRAKRKAPIESDCETGSDDKKTEMSLHDEMMQAKKRDEQKKKREAMTDAYKLDHPERYTTCISCREIVHVSQFPKMMPSTKCNHGRKMCRMCIIAWIRSQVQDGRFPSCAICQGAVNYEYVDMITKKRCDQDIFVRFHELSLRKIIDEIPDRKWCPAPGCSHVTFQDFGADKEHFFACDECKQESCLKCKGKWHQGQSCEEVELSSHMQKELTDLERIHEKEERLSNAAIKKSARKCPGFGCGVPIMRLRKDDGCDKMKCTRCGLEFCWRCGAYYSNMKKNDRVAHAPHCFWHTRQFQLWNRAPEGRIKEWEGLPQLASQPSDEDGWGEDLRDVRVRRGWQRRMKVAGEIEKTRQLLKRQSQNIEKPSVNSCVSKAIHQPEETLGLVETKGDAALMMDDVSRNTSSHCPDDLSDGNGESHSAEIADEEFKAV